MNQETSIIKTIFLQLTSNGLILAHNKKINSYSISSVDNYKVINRKIFIKELKEILSKLSIDTITMKYNISLIIDSSYYDIDKKNLKTIFRILSFNKIELINISNILDLESNELAIDISENSIKIYYELSVYHTKIYFSEYQNIIYLYLKKLLKLYKIETIKVFGNLPNLNEQAEYIEKSFQIRTYIYAYSNLYPINCLT